MTEPITAADLAAIRRLAVAMKPFVAAQREVLDRFAVAFRRMFVRVEDGHVIVLTSTGRYLRVPLGARDRYGTPAELVRRAAPTPGYTRHTLGDHEAARDTRRIRCRPPVIYRCDPPAICAASTAAGGRCARPVTAPGRRCRLHGGAS